MSRRLESGKRNYGDIPKNPDGTVNESVFLGGGRPLIPLPDDHFLNRALAEASSGNTNHEPTTRLASLTPDLSQQIPTCKKPEPPIPVRKWTTPTNESVLDEIIRNPEPLQVFIDDPRNLGKDTRDYVFETFGEEVYYTVYQRPTITLDPFGYEAFAHCVQAIINSPKTAINTFSSAIRSRFSAFSKEISQNKLTPEHSGAIIPIIQRQQAHK